MKKLNFYGGKLGKWVPLLFMLIGMIAAVILDKADFSVFILINFAAIFVAFFLCKDKKSFDDVLICGYKNDILAVLVVAFVLAGALSQLLKASGLIEALIHLASVFDMPSGIIPVMTFIICCLISTSCGTSQGSIVAIFPIMMPIGVGLGCDASLMAGAILSGAIFGDNLAPISDTTVASAVTQEQDIVDVVRTRLPYSLIAGGISALLFLVFGFMTADPGVAHVHTDGSTMPALVLLIVPVVMIVLMRRGMGLAGTLLICNTLAIAINLVFGLISPAVMIGSESPILSGVYGMIDMILFCLFLFLLIEILVQSEVLDSLTNALMEHCKGVRSVQLLIVLTSAFGSIAMAGSTGGITFAGPIANKIRKKYHISGTRVANLLDGTACAVSGLVPVCVPQLLLLSLAAGIEGIPDSYSFGSIVKYAFHPLLLLVLFIGSIFVKKIKVLDGNE